MYLWGFSKIWNVYTKGEFSWRNKNICSSPGYGLILTAETTEGVFYHGEAMSQPKGASGDPLVPEDIGQMAATRLMEQIYRVDTDKHHLLVFFYKLSFVWSRNFPIPGRRSGWFRPGFSFHFHGSRTKGRFDIHFRTSRNLWVRDFF